MSLLLPLAGGALYLANDSANRASSRSAAAEVGRRAEAGLAQGARAIEEAGENISDSIDRHAGAIARAAASLGESMSEAAKTHKSWEALLSMPRQDGLRAASYHGVLIEYMRRAWVIPSDEVRDAVVDYPAQAIKYFTTFDGKHDDGSWEFIVSNGTVADCLLYAKALNSPASVNPQILSKIEADGSIGDVLRYCDQRDDRRLAKETFKTVCTIVSRQAEGPRHTAACLYRYLDRVGCPYPLEYLQGISRLGPNLAWANLLEELNK